VARLAARDQIDLTWIDNANNEQGFRIERKIGTGAWAQIGEVPENTSSFRDNGLAPNTVYRYRIRAFNASGISGFAASGAMRTPQ
jgi:hypothetical protein